MVQIILIFAKKYYGALWGFQLSLKFQVHLGRVSFAHQYLFDFNFFSSSL